ncbi:hypothetical protein Glove_564g10 [Diversispora epigaea]|uniref:ZSWIM1/3 RNaseH-like domain-containing protein n=1 Tax=Diversispora epigaea TaxID=1348612 RepID=A0A397GA67_9GLOM|nr:hypothetical protein Glove_564g10 [Diversispora epigaea]
MDLNSSVKKLRLKEVTNIKYKVRGTLDARLISSSGREKNIQESIFFLEQKKYRVERYMISNKFTHGFIFIHQKQIENLEKYGWLTFIDSIHKTNRYNYRLFTLYIRNGYSCWDVGVHFFVSNEDSDTIAEALKIIQKFALHWKPRYFLQDQSNVEANSIKLAFPGFRNDEQECDTIFCTVHLLQTWISKIYDLESYHSELKRTTSSQHGLIGACHKVVILDQKKCTDSEYVAFEFCTKKISVIGMDDEIFNELHKFPFPIQRTLADEVCAVEKRLEKGKATSGLTSLYCNCTFYHRYLLPCRHIFHEHMYGTTKLLIVDSWTKFQWMFEENGFEVYMHHELVEVDISEEIKAEKAAENQRLAINEFMEKIRDIYWRVEKKSHYFAYNEALKTLGVKFIKQNITENILDINNLKLQIKAAQSERDRVCFLLSEYLDNPCGSNEERANLVDKFLIAFNNSDNYNIYQNSLWDITSSTNFTPDGLLHLKNCFSDGDLNFKNKKKIKNQELAMPILQESTMSTSQELMMPTSQDSFEEIPKHKKQRRVTKPSE